MSPSVLPVELLHEILLKLKGDYVTLKNCTLASHTLHYIAQEYLFTSVAIDRFKVLHRDRDYRPEVDDGGESGVAGVGADADESVCEWLLKPQNIHVLPHIRHLKVQCYPPPSSKVSIQDPAFDTLLPLIRTERITRITILRRHRDDPLRDTEQVISELLRRCEGLVELDIEERRVLASYLNACGPLLKVLKIDGSQFVEDEEPGHAWANLDTLVFPTKVMPELLAWLMLGSVTGNSHAVIEDGNEDEDMVVPIERMFPRLKHLFIGEAIKEVEAVNEVLAICAESMESFVYMPYGYNFSSYPNLCRNRHGNIIEFNVPPSLRMLALNCPIMLKPASNTSASPFGWLSHTFRRSSYSVLRTVHIKFLTTVEIELLGAIFPGGFPIDRCFREFDEVLSDRTRFPHLEKVYLTFGRHYLRLFDSDIFPKLREMNILSVIYEEMSFGEKVHYWEWRGGTRKEGENIPWNGKTCKFVNT